MKSLDDIKNDLDNVQKKKSASSLLITVPYNGVRTSMFVYHPKQMPNQATAYLEAKKLFLSMCSAWYDVADIYNEEEKLHATVIPQETKKGIDMLLREMDEIQNPYLLESLSFFLWDKEGASQMSDGKFEGGSEKVDKHFLPTMKEIQDFANEIKSEDLGITTTRGMVKGPITRHTWTG